LTYKSQCQHTIPAYLLDDLTDLYDIETFIEILIHRNFICSALVEVEREPSIHIDGIAIILPCLSMLLKWDGQEIDPSVIIYHRAYKQLKACVYQLDTTDDTVDLDQLNSLSIVERQQHICRYMNISIVQYEQNKNTHDDYHLWLMIVQYWFSVRQLSSVYIYAIIFSFIRMVHLIPSENEQCDDFQPLTVPIDNERNSIHIESNVRRSLNLKLRAMSKSVHDMKTFDCKIIHEFNCLHVYNESQ
jgi:hypothetical protein